MKAFLARLARAFLAGFLGGAAAALSTGQTDKVKMLAIGAITGGITGGLMAVGKLIRDKTGLELTP